MNTLDRRYSSGTPDSCLRSILLTAVVSCAVVSCSGSSDDNGTDPSGSGSSSNSISASIGGTMLLMDFTDAPDLGTSSIATGEIYSIDVATGETSSYVTPMPQDLLGTGAGRYASSNRFLNPSHISNGELLLGSNECITIDLGLRADSCFERIDSNGDIERLFTTNSFMLSSPAMSADGSLLASWATLSFSIAGEQPEFLTLFESDGSVVDSVNLLEQSDTANLSNLVFTRDNRLIFGITTAPDTTFIVVTEPRSIVASSDFPPGVSQNLASTQAGFVADISLSPNEQFLAYDLGNRAFVLDLTTGVHTRVASNTDWIFSRPVWSPDSRYLALDANPVRNFGNPFDDHQVIVEWTGNTMEIQPLASTGNVVPGGNGELFVVFNQPNPSPLVEGPDNWSFTGRKIWLP